MMSDPLSSATIATAALLAIIVLSIAGLKAWRGWLDLQRLSLDGHHTAPNVATNSGARIELADLKERVRKLEAIAAGVDL
jgi:hypothetical protein